MRGSGGAAVGSRQRQRQPAALVLPWPHRQSCTGRPPPCTRALPAAPRARPWGKGAAWQAVVSARRRSLRAGRAAAAPVAHGAAPAASAALPPAPIKGADQGQVRQEGSSDQPAHADVRQLGGPAGRQQHVARLDVLACSGGWGGAGGAAGSAAQASESLRLHPPPPCLGAAAAAWRLPATPPLPPPRPCHPSPHHMHHAPAVQIVQCAGDLARDAQPRAVPPVEPLPRALRAQVERGAQVAAWESGAVGRRRAAAGGCRVRLGWQGLAGRGSS